ncbi:MAG: hypothetical protein CMG75_08395 [Candidatus Marinimicrobia bacterium]|nr:hypothetical protein [Candidatus Neomarinimicrobiota bacterium]|tara:strand:+ start:3067 stop:3249 length:183 start_codon:yes stop_codon:yes gene_type:complete
MREREGETNSREELLLIRGVIQALELELMMAWQSYNVARDEGSPSLPWKLDDLFENELQS